LVRRSSRKRNAVYAICRFPQSKFLFYGNVNLAFSLREGIEQLFDRSGTIVENIRVYNLNPSDYYTYTADNAQSVKDIVKAGAGAGILNITVSVQRLPAADSPMTFELHQNFPNPFNPAKHIRFAIAQPKVDAPLAHDLRFVTLKVFDVLGWEVPTLVNEEKSPDSYSVRGDGSNPSSGIYFDQLKAGNVEETRKMVLTK
jgi:hypothetical protein